MAPVADGFWPLAPADAGQPLLFLASMDCFRSILGPGLKSYLGIIFFLLALGMNLASTYCVETWEICFFFGDVQTIFQSLFENSNYLKVAKNAGAFISRCSELFDLIHL